MRSTFKDSSEQGVMQAGFLIPETEMTSDRVMNLLLPKIKDHAVKPVFYFVDQPPDERYGLHSDLETLGFMEKTLMRDVVNPFIRESVENGTQPDGTYLPLDILAQKYNADIMHVPDMNAPDFVKAQVTDNPSPQELFMIRQRTIAKHLVEECEKKREGMLMNIHPARLPGIRGLMGTFWSRIDAEENGINSCAITMHRVNDHEIDKGPITDFSNVPFDPDRAIGTETIHAAPAIADMIAKEIEIRVFHAGQRSIVVPPAANSSYKTVPTPEEIEHAKDVYDIHLVDTEEMLNYILEHYSSEDAPEHRAELESRCRTAIGEQKARMSAKFGAANDGEMDMPGL